MAWFSKVKNWFLIIWNWFWGLDTSEKISLTGVLIRVVAVIIALTSFLYIYSSSSSKKVINNSRDTSTTQINIGAINLGNNKVETHDAVENLNFYSELSVAGVILNESGEPIPNAIVEIPSYHVRSEPSDELGKFSIYREGDTDGRDAEVRVKIDSYRVNHHTIDLNDKFVEIKMLKRGF